MKALVGTFKEKVLEVCLYLGTTLTNHHISPSQQRAPQAEGAIGVDRVVAGRQNTEIKPHQVSLGHIAFTVVRSKPHISMVAKIPLKKNINFGCAISNSP